MTADRTWAGVGCALYSKTVRIGAKPRDCKELPGPGAGRTLPAMERILDHLLSRPAEVEPIPDLDGWWSRHRAAAAEFDVPADRAMAGAAECDRLGYAFASGFREALRALIPQVGDGKVAFCATEEGGNRPRAIQSRLDPDGDGWRLTGNKKWATMGQVADDLLVFASVGQMSTARGDQGRNRIALVRVPASREGVSIAAGRDTPFVPEIPHASLCFDNVRVEPGERLEGDGYDRYLKPFRTVEDCHVHAALLAWVLQVARGSDWPEAALERLAVQIAAARGLATADPTSAGVHVGLGGLIAETARFLDDLDEHWERVDEQTRTRWRRDRALLGVAGTARARRLEVAWASLRG